MPSPTLEARRKTLRQWRGRQQARGRCIYCANGKPKPGAMGCEFCIKKIAAWSRSRARSRFELGLCRRCPNPREPKRRHCRACLDKQARLDEQRRNRTGRSHT